MTTTTSSLTALEIELRAICDRYSGKVTFALTDLTSGEHIALDEDAVMPTASLIKVPILAALYRAVQEGKVSLEDRIRYEPQHDVQGSGVLMRLSHGVEMSVRDAAVLMIIISDNAATNMVIDTMGLDYINERQREFGLKETTIFRRLGDPEAGLNPRKMNVSTAGEIVRLLTMIAKHECISPEADEDMLRIMRRLDGRGELSRLLPWNELNMLPNHKENWVAEKGGSFLNGVRTGGSIFHSERGYFVMSVFCEGGTQGGTGRNAEGNVLNGELGYSAWKSLAEPEDWE